MTVSEEYIVWKAQIAQTIPHEKRFAKELANLFKRQEKEVLANARKVNLKPVATEKQIEVKAQSDVQVILDNIVFDKKKWNKEFVKNLEPYYEVMSEDSGNMTLGRLGVGVRFDLEDAMVKQFIRNKVIKFSGFVNGETINKLNRIIKPLIEKGGSLEDIREAIQEGVKKAFKYSVRATASRARMIARTEMVGTANESSRLAAVQSGLKLEKSWIRSFDQKVRSTHIEASVKYRRGRGIPLNKPFIVGEALVSAPGNLISGDVGEIANCRCTVVYSRKR